MRLFEMKCSGVSQGNPGTAERRRALRNFIICIRALTGLALCLAWLVCIGTPLCAEGPQETTSAVTQEPIEVTGETVEYLHDQKKVIATNNVVITYKDVTLTCRSVVVDLDKREAVAEGDVKITQQNTVFTGERIVYNFDAKTGQVVGGNVKADPWYGRSESIEKVSDKEVRLHKGYVSTCDLDTPHYRLQAKELTIFLGDKIVAKHIIFFIGDMPVLYLPFFVHRLDEKRPHVSVIAGKDSEWGYYALTAWRYYLGEKNRGDVRIDYREKKGLAEGVDHYYETSEVGSGSAKFYFIDENDVTAASPSSDEVKKRWRAQWRHRWDMAGYNTVHVIEFNKLSDADFIKDYFYKEYEEEAQPDNYISSVTTNRDYTLSVLARKRMDSFFTVIERLPEVKIDVNSYRIKGSDFYYQGELSGVYLNEAFADNTEKDISTIRFDSSNRLSYMKRLFGFLNVTPYAGIRETYYSRNRWGQTNVLRTLFPVGVQTSTKFYRVFDVDTEYCGIEIHRIRHIITPQAEYYHVHQPTVSPDNLYQFDEIDALDSENGVRMSLENKLQTKQYGDGEEPTTVDLATLIVSTDYMFRLEKEFSGYKSQKFKSVDFLLELKPYPWLFVQSTLSVNTKRHDIQTGSVDFIASQSDEWSLGFGQRYESTETDTTNLTTLDMFYRLSPKWALRVYERIDVKNGKFEEQEYTAIRDLHCWTSEFTYNVKGSLGQPTDHSLWVVFRLKAFPNLPLGFRKTYSRAQPGAINASQSR